MKNYSFKFDKVYEDSTDGMLEVRLSALSPEISSQGDFYTYPEMLLEYADRVFS